MPLSKLLLCSNTTKPEVVAIIQPKSVLNGILQISQKKREDKHLRTKKKKSRTCFDVLQLLIAICRERERDLI